MSASDEEAKERCMETYGEEKRNVIKYISEQKKVNENLEGR